MNGPPLGPRPQTSQTSPTRAQQVGEPSRPDNDSRRDPAREAPSRAIAPGSGPAATIHAQAGAQFTIPGRPLPAGSKDRVPITQNGRVIGHRIVETGNRDAKAAWRADIRHHAHQAMNGHRPLEGPVRLDVVFYLQRPKHHWGTGRNQGRLRSMAPIYPIVAPDALKLTRGLEDALQGICFTNDSQVVDEHIAKRYSTPERTEVRIVPMFGGDT